MSTLNPTTAQVTAVKKLALLGATLADISDFFGITEAQLTKWIKSHTKFGISYNAGKLGADSEVAASMYKRACGYNYNEERAFSYMGDVDIVSVKRHMPADVNAGKFWLKNRQSNKWREQPAATQTTFHDPWEIEYTTEDED